MAIKPLTLIFDADTLGQVLKNGPPVLYCKYAYMFCD